MNALKSYLAHLVGYVVSASTLVAAVDPKLLPPEYAAAVAAAGLITTVAHHSYTAGSAAGLLQSVTKAVVDSAPAKLAIAFVCLGVLLALPGCAELNKANAVLAAPGSAPYIAAAVDVAVATAESKGVTAAQINAIAHKALAADSGTAATLDAIGLVVNDELAKLKLPPGDVAAIQILVLSFRAEIQKQAGASPSVAATQASVATVLNDFIEATGG